MLQAQSWFRATGSPPAHPNLIAQIFFPLDGIGLDGADRRVLDTIVSEFQFTLLANRIELRFIGHADRRGSDSYNLVLGRARGDAVKNYLDRRLGRRPFYSSWNAVSHGERFATQGRVSRERMAEDRRVDVFSSYVRNRRFTGSPIMVIGRVPRVRRIIERQFSTFSATNIGRQSRDPGAESWRDFMRLIRRLFSSGGEPEQVIAGQEDLERRGVESISASYAVNIVNIEYIQHYEVEGFAEIEWSRHIVRYTWGSPEPTVTVTRHTVFEHGENRVVDRRESQVLSRAEADSEPFVFPPNP